MFWAHLCNIKSNIYLNVPVFRICDQAMEYRLSILIGKCYLFSGKFDMSRVNNVIISLNLWKFRMLLCIQEIIMQHSSVYKCDESLLILAESLLQMKVDSRKCGLFLSLPVLKCFSNMSTLLWSFIEDKEDRQGRLKTRSKLELEFAKRR